MRKEQLLLVIKMVVFFDFLGVSFVVPLMLSYYSDANISGRLLGALASTFSISQFISGSVIGVLSDHPNRRDILIASFAGSVISYLIIGFSTNLYLLFLSRIIVGLVKQTLTITNVVISELTAQSPEDRAKELGHISAAVTLSFLIGPSIGGYLYKQDRLLPIFAAVTCFMISILITLVFIPRDMMCTQIDLELSKKEKVKETAFQHMIHLAKNHGIQQILAFRTVFFFIEMSLSSRSISRYYELKFQIETGNLGYLSSLSSGVSLFTQLFLIGPVLKFVHKDERMVIFWCLVCLIVLQLIEGFTDSIHTFVVLSYIPNILISCILSSVMKSYFSAVVPLEDTGKALAVFSIFTTAASILAPLYGAEVFHYFGSEAYKYKAYLTAAHYLVPIGFILSQFVYAPKRLIRKQLDDKVSSSNEASASVETKVDATGNKKTN